MRRHDQITVSQRGVIDRGVIARRPEIRKFSAEHEHFGPQRDLDEVSHERSQHGHYHDWKIAPETPAGAAQSSLAAQKVQRHGDGHGVDEDGAQDDDRAHRQRHQDRNAKNLRHSFVVSVPAALKTRLACCCELLSIQV